MSASVRLAELLCSRLCHDLSGALGSLMAGLELANEAAQGASEALSVADEAATVLGRRLKLFRAAWSGDGPPATAAALLGLTDGASPNRRMRLDVSGLASEAAFSPGVGRLLLNVILLAGESLPGGGVLALAGSATQGIVANLDGPRAAWPAGFAACLVDEENAWQALTDARSLQAPLTALIARHAGLRLSMLIPSGAPDAAPPLMIGPG